jgi:SAM-dependent methyltransferase
MISFTPSLDPAVATENLSLILSPRMRPELFHDDIQRLGDMFDAFVRACPPPWPAPGLALTPEIHFQSELWLPLALVEPAFRRLYRHALTWPPVLSSTPFASSLNWAEIVSAFPPLRGWPPSPSLLLERMLVHAALRTDFLCWSFMPRRFYGNGSNRYPGQTEFIRHWLRERRQRGGELRCLDAACGDGGASYALLRLLLEQGWPAESLRVEGWTLDPLEVWSAAHARFPLDPLRQSAFRQALAPLFEQDCHRRLQFRAVDLEEIPAGGERFDLIICNGLLGGPIINHPQPMERIALNLARLLRPHGMLLVADHFHGGWKKSIPRETIQELLRACGLHVIMAGEGIAGFRERPLQAAPALRRE